jgi:exosortase
VSSSPLPAQIRVEVKAIRSTEPSTTAQSNAGEKSVRTDRASSLPMTFGTAALVAAFLAAAVWSYWPIFVEMARKWVHDPQYSHAFLVPAFSAYLLWSRRKLFEFSARRPSWWGLPLLALGVFLRLFGAYVYVDWLEAISLLPMLSGAVLMLAGPRALLWTWPAIAFLGFMIPLPYRVETAVSLPLQRLATGLSTYLLQTLGRPAFAEGNVIVVNDARIGVVEACNGLGMLILFFALATALAILVHRHPIEKAVIVASAAPVAIAANVVRITATAFVHENIGGRWADIVFHDLAGWLMMPLALVILGLELQVMSRLFVDAVPAERFGPLGPVVTAARKAAQESARVANGAR